MAALIAPTRTLTSLLLISALAAVAVASQSSTGIGTFVSIGDWGGQTTGKSYDQQNQLTVAKTLTAVASLQRPEFVLNAGDNFYFYGVKNVSDPAFQTDFENIYTHESLYVPWYGALGNHDYGYNVTAQLQYRSVHNDRWVLPRRYYSKNLTVGETALYLIVLDTNPCVSAYRANDPSGWDPCGSEYPFPKDCRFHANILTQSCSAQMSWLKQKLLHVPSDSWLIVMGHHPADEVDVEDLVSLLESAPHQPDLYINGHAHTLTQYSINGNSQYITSGAGCMVDPNADPEHAEKPKPRNPHNLEGYKTVWEDRTAGFTLHTITNSTLTTHFIHGQSGQVLHSFSVNK